MNRWRKCFFGSKHISSQIWCYLKLVRWRDEDEEMNRWKKIFWVRTCIKPNLVSNMYPFIGPNLVLSEISEMKSEMNRWRKFFGSEHVSSQIWCYLKLVRWRVRWRDENFFLVWTCIKPNLVLPEISEMKSEMKRWRKFFLVRTCIKPNLVLSEISEMKSEMTRWKKKFLGPNMYQAKSGVENFSLYWGVRKSYIQANRQTNRHTYGHHSDQISRSARERRSD